MTCLVSSTLAIADSLHADLATPRVGPSATVSTLLHGTFAVLGVHAVLLEE